MVRISGGIHRGRKLRVPSSGVRPTKDMVRLALFSALGESIQGKRVADVFAGSGVIGLEAISRGAAEAVWVEADQKTHTLLCDNVDVICGAGVSSRTCIQADALVWLAASRLPDGFDLVVADPPYKPSDDIPWGTKLLEVLRESTKLKPEGLFVLEQHVDQPVIDNPAWIVLKEARYGETLLVYYRRVQKEPS